MPKVLWDDVKAWFEPDGSLIDGYVFDTSMADWQSFVDLVRSKGWWFDYQEDRRSARLPDRVADVFDRRGEIGVFLQIRPVPEIRIHVHFFTSDEIEIDFAREELQGQERLDELCRFVRAVGRRLGKPMVVTPESGRDHPLVSYDVETGRIVVHVA